MQRILKFILSMFILGFLSVSMINAQDKKSEHKIKIIIDDGSGSKVVIDTLIKDGQKTDSLKLKNGKVIFIGHPGDEEVTVENESPEHVKVTVSSDGKESKKEVKSITIISSDSVSMKDDGDGHKLLVYSDSKNPDKKSNVHYSVVSRSLGNENGEHEKEVYIIEGNDPKKEKRETYTVSVSNDYRESSVEKTKYIIAKDGMVVTVESNDEAKAKELINDIKNKLGIKDEGSDKKETKKVVTNKKVEK
jgi:hypothetical protein